MDIDSLYQAAKAGDKKSENELFRILSVRFTIFACRKVREKEIAQELVQGAILKLVQHYREMEFDVSFSAWAYKVLKNDILNHWHKKRRVSEKMDSMSHLQEMPVQATDPILESRIITCLKEMMRESRNFARVLNLKYQGYGSEEIKLRLKISSSNFYVILYRARLGMIACLERGKSHDARL